MNDYDVIVIGGGTTGVIAAVQASRAGARCLLIEKSGMCGGTMTSAGVSFPGLFHAWGRQVIAGIGWELVERCVREMGDTMPDFSDLTKRHWEHQVQVDRSLYAMLCDEALADAGVEVLFHTMIAGLRRTDDTWELTLCTKSGLKSIPARVVIDCTGDANVIALAGGEINTSDELQPGTLIYSVSGYDVETLDVDAINRAFVAEVEAGRLLITDICWETSEPDVSLWLHVHGGNRGHIAVENAQSSEGKTRLELDSRAVLLRVFRFLRTQPGLSDLRIDFMAPESGVRESVTFVGEETITVEDYESGRMWPDAVCYAFYPIDLHTIEEKRLEYRGLSEGVVPTVPLRALIPRDMPDMLGAGRCLSSDRVANSSLRVQATCMATGQAVGALAALAVRQSCDVRDVPQDNLHTMLREHGAIVPEQE
jgi:hypothetical protein